MVRLRRPPWRSDGEGHVRVLGIGEDEVLRAVRIGVNTDQVLVERLIHTSLMFRSRHSVGASLILQSSATPPAEWPDGSRRLPRSVLANLFELCGLFPPRQSSRAVRVPSFEAQGVPW